MSKRHQKSYETVFEFISQKLIDLSRTRKFHTDYEIAMRNALKKKCPVSKQSACQFHFAQAVRCPYKRPKD